MSDVTKAAPMLIGRISTGSFGSPRSEGNHPISQNYFLFNPANVMFLESDNFWAQPLASRTVSVKSTSSGFEKGSSYTPLDNFVFYGVGRTVSRQARENSIEELTLDSDLSDSEDSFPVITPIGRIASTQSTADSSGESERGAPSPKKVKINRKRVNIPEPNLPKLHLGEVGRKKLKSLISSAIKEDECLRDKVRAIGKVKLASIPQLLQMAQVCGLWDEAVLISDNFVKRG